MATITTEATNAEAVSCMGGPAIEGPVAGRTARRREDMIALPACRLRRVTEYIQHNLDKGLTLEELAAVVYMSPFHFARLFKGSTGVPPHRFVVRQRIARARACLERRELSIAQISRLVGFRTPSHFTTVFRRLAGVTPRRYRLATPRDDRPAATESEMSWDGSVQNGGLQAGAGLQGDGSRGWPSSAGHGGR
jgi:AraC-like DNA-binding protein